MRTDYTVSLAEHRAMANKVDVYGNHFTNKVLQNDAFRNSGSSLTCIFSSYQIIAL